MAVLRRELRRSLKGQDPHPWRQFRRDHPGRRMRRRTVRRRRMPLGGPSLVVTSRPESGSRCPTRGSLLSGTTQHRWIPSEAPADPPLLRGSFVRVLDGRLRHTPETRPVASFRRASSWTERSSPSRSIPARSTSAPRLRELSGPSRAGCRRTASAASCAPSFADRVQIHRALPHAARPLALHHPDIRPSHCRMADPGYLRIEYRLDINEGAVNREVVSSFDRLGWNTHVLPVPESLCVVDVRPDPQHHSYQQPRRDQFQVG